MSGDDAGGAQQLLDSVDYIPAPQRFLQDCVERRSHSIVDDVTGHDNARNLRRDLPENRSQFGSAHSGHRKICQYEIRFIVLEVFDRFKTGAGLGGRVTAKLKKLYNNCTNNCVIIYNKDVCHVLLPDGEVGGTNIW